MIAALASVSPLLARASGACEFDNDPVNHYYYWDSTCQMGELGCNADGRNVQCRYCGPPTTNDTTDYSSVPCPPSFCFQDGAGPTIPYFWDPECRNGGESLGCNADGQHVECRFCDHPLFWDTHFSGVSCPDDDEKVGMPPSDVANGLESLASVAAPASPGAAPVKAAMGGGSRRLREVFV